ncbi:hypothetical protein VTL71DRAFT_14802 [Oculimacula yallundae]|uniref:Uncharacterized protein n=1 Tax=Oculimacula yallundae TaxID=86028 RepID=A0ABR4CK60_9HELO
MESIFVFSLSHLSYIGQTASQSAVYATAVFRPPAKNAADCSLMKSNFTGNTKCVWQYILALTPPLSSD